MDHVSLGARELSGTRAAASASNFTAACKSRLRIALAEPLFLIRCVVSPGTTQSGVDECRLPTMKIVIPGGTGQVGRILCRAFASAGDEVVVLSRKANPERSCRCVQWDGESVGDWAKELEDATVVINLAGRSVNCRYGKKNRREILDSRVNSVRAIRSAIDKAKNPPRVWLQASTATIYAHRFDAPNDEFGGAIGGNES